MQGTSYIPETSHVCRVCTVAAVLYVQSVLHVMLFRPWNKFCTFTSALPAVCVRWPIWLVFCSFLISCFPGMMLRCFMNDFEMVPLVSVITVIFYVFTLHMCCTSIVRSLYFRNFAGSFLDHMYVVGSNSFRPDIQKPLQMENAVRNI